MKKSINIKKIKTSIYIILLTITTINGYATKPKKESYNTFRNAAMTINQLLENNYSEIIDCYIETLFRYTTQDMKIGEIKTKEVNYEIGFKIEDLAFLLQYSHISEDNKMRLRDKLTSYLQINGYSQKVKDKILQNFQTLY